MFEIGFGDGAIILAGRLDAAQADKARQFLDGAGGPSVLDFAQLEYISSAGLGVLLALHKRLLVGGGGLRLIHVNRHLHDIFRFSGFDRVFAIETAP